MTVKLKFLELQFHNNLVLTYNKILCINHQSANYKTVGYINTAFLIAITTTNFPKVLLKVNYSQNKKTTLETI